MMNDIANVAYDSATHLASQLSHYRVITRHYGKLSSRCIDHGYASSWISTSIQIFSGVEPPLSQLL